MAKILDAQRDSLPIFVVVSQSDVQYAFCNRDFLANELRLHQRRFVPVLANHRLLLIAATTTLRVFRSKKWEEQHRFGAARQQYGPGVT